MTLNSVCCGYHWKMKEKYTDKVQTLVAFRIILEECPLTTAESIKRRQPFASSGMCVVTCLKERKQKASGEAMHGREKEGWTGEMKEAEAKKRQFMCPSTCSLHSLLPPPPPLPSPPVSIAFSASLGGAEAGGARHTTEMLSPLSRSGLSSRSLSHSTHRKWVRVCKANQFEPRTGNGCLKGALLITHKSACIPVCKHLFAAHLFCIRILLLSSVFLSS